MYCGDDLDLLRWTGINGTVGTSHGQQSARAGPVDAIRRKAITCSGSAAPTPADSTCRSATARSRTINYSIDGEVYRRLGNRKDGLPIDGSQF